MEWKGWTNGWTNEMNVMNQMNDMDEMNDMNEIKWHEMTWQNISSVLYFPF